MARFDRVTKPHSPIDEVPLTREDVAHMLGAMPAQMVLFGGQALAFWMDYYGVTPGAGAEITSDGNVLGTLEDARLLARRLGGKLRLPPPSALVDQVRLPLPSEALERNIDVLHKLYDLGGLRKSTDFTRHAVARARVIELESGIQFRVLHPMDLLTSRVNNAAGLLDIKGRHVLTQVKRAIKVMRHAFLNAASSNDPARVSEMFQEVQRLAKASAGRALFKSHDIEVFDAIPIKPLTRLRPEFKELCARMTVAIIAQRAKEKIAISNRATTQSLRATKAV